MSPGQYDKLQMEGSLWECMKEESTLCLRLPGKALPSRPRLFSRSFFRSKEERKGHWKQQEQSVKSSGR